ncbi:uncharacterized protein LOC113290027 isoform X2 [Papaver somniferum]|uniref:uncharacterized protein LOC113290027 isoform X2 n=1 Tax=Papaver somniferum TaxID=3469 RepID=UPI000E702B45|nr:uncharacterized protein LOC113290027 isoform X2 [Papaver somniferum]
MLQLGSEHPKCCYNISLCKIFGSHWNHEKRRFPQGAETELVYVNKGEQHKRASEIEPKQDAVHIKKRKTSDSKPCKVESQQEHFLSLSQNSSPSQSDQEQTPIKETPRPLCLLKQRFLNPNVNNVEETQPNQISSSIRSSPQDFHFVSGENPRHTPKQEQFLHMNVSWPEGQFSMDHKPTEAMPVHFLIGADVRGKVDGAFDPGFLMTANVNGKIVRGILFAPGNGFVPRGAVLPPSSPALDNLVLRQIFGRPSHRGSVGILGFMLCM